MQEFEEITKEEQAILDGKEPEPTPAEEPAEPQAAPVEEAQEQPAPEEQAAEQPGKPPEGFVPHGAMHKEREERKAAEARAAALEARLAAFEAAAKPAPEEPEEPQYVDPVEDPEGYRKYDQYHKDKQAAQIKAQQDEREAALAQQQRITAAQTAEEAFIKDQPDYPDAVKHLAETRMANLRQAGLNEQQVRQQIQKDYNELFDAAKAIGMNPAKLAYIRAQEFGYAPTPKVDPAEAQRLQAQAAAADATQTLSGAGGGSQAGGITAQDLANMSQEEFDKLSDADFQRAMGG